MADICIDEPIRQSSYPRHQVSSRSLSDNTRANNFPRSSQNTSIAVPWIPGLELDLQFDTQTFFRPHEIYMTAIHLMVELARRQWEDPLFAMVADHVDGFNVVIMILNPRRPSESEQLLMCHCVVALYRVVAIMTDGVMFCKMRAIIKMGNSYELGALSMSPMDRIDGSVNQTKRDLPSSRNKTTMNDSNDAVSVDRGRLVDPENFLFVIEYLWYGKSIRSREISLAILDAIATAAPHGINSNCERLEVVSPEGDCVLVVDQLDTAGRKLTYFYAVRALELAYDDIFIKYKRWGDLLLMLRFNDRPLGEIRILKGVEKGNRMAEA